MTKVVINTCYGGFGLSHEAILRYAELKGISVYPEKGKYSHYIYWTIPPGKERDGFKAYDAQDSKWNDPNRTKWNNFYKENTMIYDRDIPRTDPILIQVVEELGDKANGDCADLCIEDIPEGTLYRITEYDGNEGIETNDTMDWSVA